MPTYTYECEACGKPHDRVVPVDERDFQYCGVCDKQLFRRVAGPMFVIKGRVSQGGGPDRFVADQLGIPLGELPEGLKTKT